LEAEVPAYELVLGGGAPQYTREYKEPKYFEKIAAFDMNSVEDITDVKTTAEQIIQIPNIASKRWVYTI
jgi:phosphoribosylformylglycinamidine synthase